MNLRLVVSVILGAVLFWILNYFFLYWLPGGILVSIILGILGAVVAAKIQKVVATQFGLMVNPTTQFIAAATGAAVILYSGVSMLTSNRADISFDCDTGDVDPDWAYVDRPGVVTWQFYADGAPDSEKKYTITIEHDRSPFKQPNGSYKKKLEGSVRPGGNSPDEPVRANGFFKYSIQCDGGPKVDPMIQVPKP